MKYIQYCSQANKLFSLTVFLISITLNSYSQNISGRIEKIKELLEEKSFEINGLNEKVDFSVSNVTIQDFLRGIAETHRLNLSVDPEIKGLVINNFNNTTVKDVLVFLAQEYNLDYYFIGSIMVVKPLKKPIKKKAKVRQRVMYDSNEKTISFDLKQDTLQSVLKEIIRKTPYNVIAVPQIQFSLINGYVESLPIEIALQKMALSNGLKVEKDSLGIYNIFQAEPIKQPQTKSNHRTNNDNLQSTNKTSYQINDFNDITVVGFDAKIEDVIKNLSKKLNIYYFISTPIPTKKTFQLINESYPNILNYLLSGTDYSYELKDGVYIFSKRNEEGTRKVELLYLQHRITEKIIDFIPKELKGNNINIKEFPELNTLIVSGSEPDIKVLKDFIFEIDKPVPVILIEVLLVDYNKTYTKDIGFEMGIGDSPASPSQGKIFPELNYNMDASSINELISGFNGYGLVKLGKVTSNFYMTIQALETQGIVKLRSTPKLATLNGHEATMSIGKTAYYFEQTNNVITNQSTQNIITKQYKSVNADLTITIKPIVSGDQQITLEITVTQSDFTERIANGAPPGKVNRSFKSIIRIGNEEMILLGGLEQKGKRETGSGVPFLSRIPIIKWFFSSRNREDINSRLNIFIKPTVIN